MVAGLEACDQNFEKKSRINLVNNYCRNNFLLNFLINLLKI